MKKRLFPTAEIIVSLGLIPFWFLKIFHGIGHLPSQSDQNEIIEVHFYHSMYENVTGESFEFMFPLSVALLILSAIFATVRLKYPSSAKIRICGRIVFALAVIAFSAALIMASTVCRGY